MISQARSNTISALAPWLLAALLALAAGTPALAQQRYIDDTLYVPLRSGASTAHRILHQGLASGTAVTLVQEDQDAGWSLVRTADGIEGWLPSRYLKRDPGARQEIARALRQLGAADDGSTTLEAALTEVQTRFAAVTAERDELQAELAEKRQLWNNADELDASNRQLTEQVQTLKNQIDVLEAERRRLSDDIWQKWFINGVWATGMGGLLTLLLPRLFRRRKRYSEWG